jgi:hypothetical protein
VVSRHEWVFEVLTDLAAYAEANGLTELARKAREALDVAREEVAHGPEDPADGSDAGGSRRH